MDLNLSIAEKNLLLILRDHGPVSPAVAAGKLGGMPETAVLVAADGLARHGLIQIEQAAEILHGLTGEGLKVKSKHLPERRSIEAIIKAGGRLSMANLASAASLTSEEVPVAIGWLKRKSWAAMQKGSNGSELVANSASVPPLGIDETTLAKMTEVPVAGRHVDGIRELQGRGGLVFELHRVNRTLKITPVGTSLSKAFKTVDFVGSVEVNQVTPELIAKWPTLPAAERAKHSLRPFDFNVPVAVPNPGKAHPLTHIIQEIRDIFVSLGFSEIAGDYVEPAFWNMDALFIPQDHPARDMQDTFYLKSPQKAPIPDKFYDAVRDIQLTGGKTGSTGWGGSFKREESERTLLRTHTTVTTIRHLAAHPAGSTRVFGIGRVFRNEAMDATHLPEFHQVEGIIVEEGATLAMLMGVLREFYKRMGFPEVKFRPSFYPYTEPSLDVAVKWGDKWLELGGAGVFRPEVTSPLGVKHNVLAWGLGLERLAMLRLGLKDIRQLYLSDIEWLRTTPVR